MKSMPSLGPGEFLVWAAIVVLLVGGLVAIIAIGVRLGMRK
jgi:hypothetical protein